ncbi:MAG: regulatory protein RecX [SAR324 cluster bacterium]|nr:regulatory protein RecX [SAR324 cluster bacterium]
MQSIDHELKIEKVAEAPNGAMRLLLSDGSEWVLGVKSWNRLNLSLEKILDVNVLRALEKESQYHLLRTKALELLGIREHSRQELKRKLIARFYNHEPEIERCLEELQSEDYLSDQRFTQLFIESRLNNKRVGPFKIVADLQQRGIDRDTAHSIMDELADEEFWLSKIKDNLEELCKGNKKNNRQALGQKLFQRGFAYELINQALNDLNFSRY